MKDCNCFIGYNQVWAPGGVYKDLISKDEGEVAANQFNYCPLCGVKLEVLPQFQVTNKRLAEDISDSRIDFSDLKDTINEIFKNYEGDVDV